MKNSVDKAKFYDLIIDRAKKELDACGSPTCDTANLIFKLIPELNIDKDEMIKNEIIQFLQLPHPQFVGKRDHEEWIDWLKKQGKQPSSAYDVCEVKGPDYEGLTDFEKALVSACVGWMGKKPNWQHYIKDNADILLRIANGISNSIQDAPFEKKPNQFDEGFKAGFTAAKFNQWKPSDEQIKAIQESVGIVGELTPRGECLKELEEQLKKLKEEQVTVCEVKPKYNIGDIIGPLNDELQRVVGIVYDADGDRYILERIRDNKRSSADAHAIDSTATLIQKGL